MHPRFLMEFAKQVRPGKREKHPHSGIGSSVELDAAVLPALTLGLGSFPASLSAGHHVFLRETPYQELMPLHGQLGIDLLGQSQSVTLDFNAMRLVLDGSPPAASEAKTCVLPPRFACQRGWTCTVKADPEVHCMIDRSPDTPWPGNPLSDEASDDGDAEICRYTLPKQFTCEEGSTCIVVFRGAGHVEKIPRGGYRPASPVSSQ